MFQTHQAGFDPKNAVSTKLEASEQEYRIVKAIAGPVGGGPESGTGIAIVTSIFSF
jgi:hypothetical protein